MIVSGGDGTAGDSHVSVEISITSAGKIEFTASNGSSLLVDVTSSTAINDGIWHQVVCERLGTIWGIYIDGVSSGGTTQAMTVNFAAGTYFTIGSKHTLAQYFTGYLSDISISKGVSRLTAPSVGGSTPGYVVSGGPNPGSYCQAELLYYSFSGWVAGGTRYCYRDSSDWLIFFFDFGLWCIDHYSTYGGGLPLDYIFSMDPTPPLAGWVAGSSLVYNATLCP